MVKSTPVTSAAPITPTAMPSQATALIRRPSARARSAAQIGWVDTRAVADATLVSLRLGTQVPKCAASSTPAPRHPSHSRRLSCTISDRARNSATGASTVVAIALRQNAIANAGAAVAAISGPDVDTPRMAIAISQMSR